MSLSRHRLVMGLLLLLLIGVFTVNLGQGAVAIAPAQVAAVFLQKAGIATSIDVPPLQASVMWSIRLPRAIMALVLGAALSVSGVALQGVFRNPLAEPSLLGISSGAVVASMVATVVRTGGAASPWAGPLAGFVGALVVSMVLYRLFERAPKRDVTTFVLYGVIANVILGAIMTLLPAVFRGSGLGVDAAFWTMGGLGGTMWPTVRITAPLSVGAALLLWRMSPQLNLLALGDAEAEHLGVDVRRVRMHALVLVAVVTGAAVAFAGVVAFVGLVVPHALRLALGPDHRRLLPAGALGGALMVTLSDLLARTVVSPSELPVGVFTTLAGGPLFFWLLHQGRSRGSWV